MTVLVRNMFANTFIGLIVFGVSISGDQAFAMKAKPRPKAPIEQFKAVDAGQTIGIDNDPDTGFDEEAPKPSTKAKAEVSTPPPAVVPSSALLPKDRGTFERVPDGSKDSIAKRLKIIETLILEYGRAYDYRIHTTQELNAILDDLKKKTPSDNAPQSS